MTPFTPPISALSPTLAVAQNNTGGGFWMPPDASTIAGPIDSVFFFIYWLCVFFFVLIVGLMTYFVIKYRRKQHVAPQSDALTHHTPLELTWTIIPLILVIAIFYVGLKGYADMVQEPQNAYEVYLTGQRWSWAFEHRNGATESDLLTVPANRPVKLVMSSTDVLHSVFIPAFRVKQDVVPGRYTSLWFEADPGVYQLLCTEYCGTEHSQMTATVRVLPEEEFQVAITEAANWIEDYTDENLYQAGLRLYARCSSCHTLDGVTKIGPSFQETHRLWGKERALADGSSVLVDENYIRTSILNPGGQIAAPYPNQMPTFAGQLKEREVTALVEFIKRLNEVVDDQGNPLP